MELVLIKYQGKDWNGHLKIHDGMPEFFSVCFTSHSATVMTVDIYIHTRRIGSRMILSVFSPYWIINKTSRILQYRAEDTYVKHPADYRDIVLFSFKKKNIFSKNKVCLFEVVVMVVVFLKSCFEGGKKPTCIHFCLRSFFVVFKSIGFHLAAAFFLLIILFGLSRREGR